MRTSLLAPLLAFCIGVESPLWAQTISKAKLVQQIDTDIKKWEPFVVEWSSRADAIFYLGLVLIVLGGVVALFQLSKKKWVPYLVAGIGIAVSVVAATKEYKYPGDAKVLSGYARQGRDLIVELRELGEQAKTTDDGAELEEIRSKFLRQAGVLLELKNKALVFSRRDGAAGVVYAQSRQPAWVTTLPQDSGVIQRVGRGESPSLVEAKKSAFEDAVKLLSRDLPSPTSQAAQATQVGAGRDFLAAQAEVRNTYFEFDKARGVYRYYMWLRFDRALTSDAYLPQVRVQNSVDVQVSPAGSSKVAIEVRAQPIGDGHFIFRFTVQRVAAGRLELRLNEVEVLQDGSAGITRWYFDVFVDGAALLSLPEARYDDSPDKRLTKFADKAATVKSASSLRITVSGYKPKDYQ